MKKRYLSVPRWLVGLTLIIALSAQAQSHDPACGDQPTGQDYRISAGAKLDIVEKFHFTPEVEALLRGKSSTHVGQDLSYTLGAFPNHHRALMSMMLYGKKLNSPQPPYAKYSVSCYFTRAIAFRPDDLTVRLMFASYLVDQARHTEALQELAYVGQAAGDNAFTHYNLGLIYFDMKAYDKALVQAHRAQALGFTRTGLQSKLSAAGQWHAPTTTE